MFGLAWLGTPFGKIASAGGAVIILLLVLRWYGNSKFEQGYQKATVVEVKKAIDAKEAELKAREAQVQKERIDAAASLADALTAQQEAKASRSQMLADQSARLAQFGRTLAANQQVNLTIPVSKRMLTVRQRLEALR